MNALDSLSRKRIDRRFMNNRFYVKMRIALLTYFASSSYGATLQTYATIKILKMLGHEVELVNYVIPEPRVSLLIRWLLVPKMHKLKKFREKYFDCISEPYPELGDLQKKPPKADAYLIGSDQTWNPDISREKAKGFFLDFGSDKVKRITYAASIGKNDWTSSQWISDEEVRRLLSRFDKILIREKSGQRILKEKFGIDSEQVIDPVLLFKDYPEITGPIQETDELVTFKFKKSTEFYEKMRCLSASLDVRARVLGSLHREKGMLCSYPEGMELWVKRLASAKYVVTDSFHGAVVSILYHRPFLVYMARPERFARLKDLLTMLGLEERIASMEESNDALLHKMNKAINWNTIDSILEKKREESIKLLKEELI